MSNIKQERKGGSIRMSGTNRKQTKNTAEINLNIIIPINKKMG